MNRLNTFIILFFSFALTVLVMYLFITEQYEKEIVTITAPLKIETYRIDRFPLPDADIYLNQKFIGKTDEKGFFSTNVDLNVGESYTLIIERENNGYEYGPWETHFKVVGEEQRAKKKEKKGEENMPTLEGESDILTELQRAELGKASLYEKYHFLAIIDGHMYYTLEVRRGNPVADASVIINGTYMGKTDRTGRFTVQYSGQEKRKEEIQVSKEGEHTWIKRIDVYPDAVITADLDRRLSIEMYAVTDNYNVIRGIEGTRVFIDDRYMGISGPDGRISFNYESEKGVDRELQLVVLYPSNYFPDRIVITYDIHRELPALQDYVFSYTKTPVPPGVAVFPLAVSNRDDPLLKRKAEDVKTRIIDYLTSAGVFHNVSSKAMQLAREEGLTLAKKGVNWSDIPEIKSKVDGVIFGSLGRSGTLFQLYLCGVDYTGEVISEINKFVTMREVQSVLEDFTTSFMKNFPFEGNISSIGNKMYINLGRRQGVARDNKFYSYYEYFDRIKGDYSKKRVARLVVVDTGETLSACTLETISEGYLLEAGGRVKRYREPIQELKEIPVTIVVTSGRDMVGNANVYLDDRWRGQTNENGELQLSLAESLDADILVYKEGYKPAKIALKVREDSRKITVDLRRGKTAFIVDSNPRDALLFIDGDFKGKTPIIKKPIQVPYGYHLVELKREGYKEYKKYISFGEKRFSLTGDEAVRLYKDYYTDAENEYKKGNIHGAIITLQSVSREHPDFGRAAEFLAFIYLNDLKDNEQALYYYNRAIEVLNDDLSVISYYNMGQAYFNIAEKLFYTDARIAEENYRNAISAFNVIREKKNRLNIGQRKNVYQNTLFYLSVSYQKLYYMTNQSEYLTKAFYSWADYFDFFNEKLMEEQQFRDQYAVAVSYRDEVKRLRGEK